jgi:hypothetical protein
MTPLDPKVSGPLTSIAGVSWPRNAAPNLTAVFGAVVVLFTSEGSLAEPPSGQG